MTTYFKAGGMMDRVECRRTPIVPPSPEQSDARQQRPGAPGSGAPSGECRSLLTGRVTHLLEPDSPLPAVKLAAGGRVSWTDRTGHYHFPLDTLELPLRLTISAPGCIEQEEILDWSPVATGGVLIRDFQLLPRELCPVVEPSDSPLQEITLDEVPVPDLGTIPETCEEQPSGEMDSTLSLAELKGWLAQGSYLPPEVLPCTGEPLNREVAGLIDELVKPSEGSTLWDLEREEDERALSRLLESGEMLRSEPQSLLEAQAAVPHAYRSPTHAGAEVVTKHPGWTGF